VDVKGPDDEKEAAETPPEACKKEAVIEVAERAPELNEEVVNAEELLKPTTVTEPLVRKLEAVMSIAVIDPVLLRPDTVTAAEELIPAAVIRPADDRPFAPITPPVADMVPEAVS
jgi:hypothetical protein